MPPDPTAPFRSAPRAVVSETSKSLGHLQQRTLIGSITVFVIARKFSVDIIPADFSVTSHNPVVTMAETCPAVFVQSILIEDHSPHVYEHRIFFGTQPHNAQTLFVKIGDQHPSLCSPRHAHSWRRDQISTQRTNWKTLLGIVGRCLYVKKPANIMGW